MKLISPRLPLRPTLPLTTRSCDRFPPRRAAQAIGTRRTRSRRDPRRGAAPRDSFLPTPGGGPDRPVAEGQLDSYGELAHAWGDEWNVVDFFTAPDLDAAIRGMTAAHAAASEQTPDLLDRLAEFCGEHKDNIYTIRHLSPGPATSSPPGQ